MKPEFRDEHIPLGYLITIRAYGTWLHGSPGSVDRFHNTYGTPKLPANEKRKEYNRHLLAQEPVKLGTKTRRAVELGIRETCEIRKWTLWAFNVRTNHVHAVVSANCKPKKLSSHLRPMLRGKCETLIIGRVKEVHGWAAVVRSIYGMKKR